MEMASVMPVTTVQDIANSQARTIFDGDAFGDVCDSDKDGDNAVNDCNDYDDTVPGTTPLTDCDPGNDPGLVIVMTS